MPSPLSTRLIYGGVRGSQLGSHLPRLRHEVTSFDQARVTPRWNKYVPIFPLDLEGASSWDSPFQFFFNRVWGQEERAVEDFDCDPTVSSRHSPCTCPPPAHLPALCLLCYRWLSALTGHLPYEGGLLPGDPPRRALPLSIPSAEPRATAPVCNLRTLRVFSLL